MRKALFLGAAAAFVLAAGGVSAAPNLFPGKGGAKTLYDQTADADPSVGSYSQNFESTFAAYNVESADDFVVPDQTVWTVKELDAVGFYVGGSGPSTSENVTFYKDNNGVPGKAIKKGTFIGLNGQDSAGSFTFSFGDGLKLKSGHYWVSVVPNCNGFKEPVCGFWEWTSNKVQHGDLAQFRNPPGGYGYCQDWDTIANCTFGQNTDPDLTFVLKGKAKSK